MGVEAARPASGPSRPDGANGAHEAHEARRAHESSGPGEPKATKGPAGASPEPPRETLLQAAAALLRDVRGLFDDRVELLVQELGAAGAALVRIALMVVGAALVAATSWLALWAGVAGLLVWLGWHWSWALLALALVHALAALGALLYARSLLPYLQLRATRRHLFAFTPSPGPRSDELRDPALHAAVEALARAQPGRRTGP